jgi:hypothetical protein
MWAAGLPLSALPGLGKNHFNEQPVGEVHANALTYLDAQVKSTKLKNTLQIHLLSVNTYTHAIHTVRWC